MKTVKKVLSTIIAIAILSACSEPIDYRRNINSYSQKTDFHLEAEVVAAPFYYQDNLNLGATEALNCNLAKSVLVAIFGVKNIQDEQGGFKLSSGTMNLVIPDSGCYLVGRFTGRGGE